MSDKDTPQDTPQPSDDGLNNAGFESEVSEPTGQQEGKNRTRKSDEMKRNLSAVFGHGPGKFALIAVAAVLVIGLALGYRGLTAPKVVIANNAQMDVPIAPTPSIEIAPISDREAARRAQAASLEAEKAAAKGQTYQPGFDPNIVETPKYQAPLNGGAQFNVGNVGDPPAPRNQAITVGAGQSTASSTDGSTDGSTGYSNTGKQTQTTPQSQQQAQAEQQALARREQEYQAAKTERDKYVNTMREQILKQVAGVFGDGQQPAPVNAIGAYTAVSYYAAKNPSAIGAAGDVKETTTGNMGATTEVSDKLKPTNGLNIGDPKGRLLIKTGNMMYATLDSEINTDDGGEILATIRGGKYAGSKIVGRIEQSPNNIRAKFTVLAPQDDRPTMLISAVALREDDAKQGIAENIDYHTLSRYTSLGVSSLLTGFGKAYATPTGTTVVTNGTVVTTTEEPTNKRIAATVIGEVGGALSSEVRRGFSRPTTYSTPAQHGFGIFFLQDVYDQSK